MNPAEFIAFAQTRHGEKWFPPMAEETDYSYAHLYAIAKRGRRVGKHLARIVSELPAKPKKRKSGS
jgi:hypothetical protein